MPSELLAQLRLLFADQPAAVLAYCFGSRATGRNRPDSDLDLAVLWDRTLDGGAQRNAEHRLRAALAENLGRLGEEADLVDLARAGTILGFRVIRDGKLLLVRSPSLRVQFEARIARAYDDEAPYRQLFRRAALRFADRMKEASDG